MQHLVNSLKVTVLTQSAIFFFDTLKVTGSTISTPKSPSGQIWESPPPPPLYMTVHNFSAAVFNIHVYIKYLIVYNCQATKEIYSVHMPEYSKHSGMMAWCDKLMHSHLTGCTCSTKSFYLLVPIGNELRFGLHSFIFVWQLSR